MESIIETLGKQPAEPGIKYPSMQGIGIEEIELPAEPNQVYDKMPPGHKTMQVKDFAWQTSKVLREAFREGPNSFVNSLSHWTGSARGAEVFDKDTMQELDALQQEAATNRYDKAALEIIFNKVIKFFSSLKCEKRR